MLKPLFTAPDEFAQRGLAQLFLALDEVMPMNGAQRRDLAMACRDLSAMLTTERDSLDRPYWTAPRLTSAYLRYFLPWNLVRLSSLLPGLDFGDIPDEPLILDMGSGPLTMPLALWLSRPDLRSKPVTIVAKMLPIVPVVTWTDVATPEDGWDITGMTAELVAPW